MERVKKQPTQRGTRISSKNQVTIPVRVLEEAGLRAGERLVVRADGSGRLVLEREVDLVAEFAGSLSGLSDPDALDRLRDEWD